MKIYLDMDGVLADFDKHLLDRYGLVNDRVAYSTKHKDKTEKQMKLFNDIGKVMKDKGFFRNLPLMPGAHDLWKAAHRGGNKPYVLTALPGIGNDEEVAKDKREWIHEYMNEVHDDEFIACMRSEKIKYATTYDGRMIPEYFKGPTYKPNILVDDLPLNCDNWKSAGGYGILFQNSKQAIAALDEAHKYIYGERIDVA